MSLRSGSSAFSFASSPGLDLGKSVSFAFEFEPLVPQKLSFHLVQQFFRSVSTVDSIFF